MHTKIKHVAIVSENYATLCRFYEALFGMKTSPKAKPEEAAAISDGYVGMNVIPRKMGRQAGFEHYGLEVDDIEEFQRRVASYSGADFVKRPSNRPFASFSANDPAGNVLDVTQQGMSNVANVYADIATTEVWNPRHLSHFAIRTVDAARVADFYREVFELAEVEKKPDDPSFYFTDGKVTMVIAPWAISNYEGMGVERPEPDHLGFEVNDLAKFETDLQALSARNPVLAPRRGGTEGDKRIELLKRCPFGSFHFADPDGNLLDVHGPAAP